jgi:hypothetical protein
LPHDGRHGNIRGDSVSSQLADMGLPNIVLPREIDISAGIELLRKTLAYSVFDDQKCVDGIHALENYAYEWNDERLRFDDRPKHDWTSHYSDAARYAVIAAGTMKNIKPAGDNPFIKHTAGSWMAH